MLLTEQISLAFAVITLGTQLALRSQVFYKAALFRRLAKYYAAAAFTVVLGILAYWTVAHFRSWSADPFFKGFLPPTTPISYFIGYVGSNLIYPYLLAIAAAMVLAYAMKLGNKKFDSRFFEDEEPILAALAVFLTGYPAFLLYVPLMLIAGALLSVAYQMLNKGRAPLYYLWLPVAIIVILISHFVLPPAFQMFFRL